MGKKPMKIVTSRVKLSSFSVGNYEFNNATNEKVGGRYVIILALHRYYMYYVLTVYFPNTLVILLAWSSFW